MNTREENLQILYNRMDKHKADIEQLDDDLLCSLADGELLHAMFVCLDESKEEYEVTLGASDGEVYSDKLIYRGKDLEVATQIRNNLLNGFKEVQIIGFNRDGCFYM